MQKQTSKNIFCTRSRIRPKKKKNVKFAKKIAKKLAAN